MSQLEMFDSVNTVPTPSTNYEMIVQVISAKAETAELMEKVSRVLMLYNDNDEFGSNVFIQPPSLSREAANELYSSLTFIHGCLSTVISEHLNVQEQEAE